MLYARLSLCHSVLTLSGAAKVLLPKHVSAAARILEDGFRFGTRETLNYRCFESNLEFPLRFMIETNVVGCNWIELPPSHYRRRIDGSEATSSPRSRCQYEFDIAWDKLVSHPVEGEWLKVAPLRVMSFDIECAGRQGIFPEPEHDPIIQIATMVKRPTDAKPFIRCVMTLDSCANIVGSEVLSFDSEADLLARWADMVRTVDPDILTGYNINNFDLWYLLSRAEHLKVKSFPSLGRMRGVVTRMRSRVFSSKAYGTRESKEINIEGRCLFDLMQVLLRDYKLRSYSLNAVSAHFLNEQKEDVHHSIISDLQRGNEQTRRRLAVYCLKVRSDVGCLRVCAYL
jgi:DNA polymerase delta subunit 1